MPTIYSHYAKPLTRNRPFAYAFGVATWRLALASAPFRARLRAYWPHLFVGTCVSITVVCFFVSGHAYDAFLRYLASRPLPGLDATTGAH